MVITFKLVRKVGRMLRGGAGKREIFIGSLCGVLIGMVPGANLTLALAILLALLLNGNIGFALLGLGVGKLLELALAPVTFQIGYFIIHNIGLEGLFTRLANAPVTALMDLNVYCLVGGAPFVIAAGIAFGKFMASSITHIREHMLMAEQHEQIGKAVGNKFSRFLIWLAFGKQKISTADVLAKTSPLLRKSGLILVGAVVVIGLVLEFFLLDVAVKKGLQSAISAQTGAEVDIGKARLSLARGKLDIRDLQAVDPDQPANNLFQIDTLVADVNVGDLLRKSYVVDLLEGGVLKRDVPRSSPGKVFPRKEKPKPAEEAGDGVPLADYFAKAKEWEKYGDKAYDYLKQHRAAAKAKAEGEKQKPSKQKAVADAKTVGRLKASADLAANRPAWTIRQIRIDQVLPGGGYPAQKLEATEISSHPELNGQPTTIVMTPVGGTEPSAKLVLRFDDPAAPNQLAVNLSGISIGGAVAPGPSFPLDIGGGKADIKADGTFTADALDLPFTVVVHDLKAKAEEGKRVMGMDAKTATEVFSSMERIDLDGSLGGSLRSPRIKVDTGKLAANVKQALVAAGKKELADRAAAETEKAKAAVKEKAGAEVDKLLKGDDAKSAKEKAKDAIKSLF